MDKDPNDVLNITNIPLNSVNQNTIITDYRYFNFCALIKPTILLSLL